MLLEGGTSSKRIPDTLQAMIAARIDRLPREREAAAPAGRRDRPDLLGGRRRPPAARRSSDLEPVLRRPAPARLHHPREPLVDHRRARLPLQARPHPRRRLRGARQGRPRRAAPAGRRLAARGSRARSSSRSAPTTSITRRRCWRSSTARRREELAKRAAGALEKAGRRALAQEANQAARRLLVRSVELEPTLQRRFLAARAARRIADLPAQAVEMERVFADATEAGDVRAPGPRARQRSPRTRSSATPICRAAASSSSRRSCCSTTRSRRTGSRRWRPRARIGWWLGDLDDDERWNTKALEVAREIGRKDLEASAADELASSAIAGSTSTGGCGSWRSRSSSRRRAATSP